MSKKINLNVPKEMYHLTDEFVLQQKKLRKVNIHKNVTKLDFGVFYNQKTLKKVYFEKNSKIKVISSSAFEGCTSLENIILPEELTTIEENAFKNCTSIKELRIPKGVLKVDSNAFYGWGEDQVIYTPIPLKKPITCKAAIVCEAADEKESKKLVRKKGEDNYYLVTVKCGHVGRHRYMPITFPIKSENAKDAVNIARNIPRVKRNHPDFVIDVRLTDEQGFLKQSIINAKDPYLKVERKADQNKIIHLFEDRLIDEPNYQRNKLKKEVKFYGAWVDDEKSWRRKVSWDT